MLQDKNPIQFEQSVTQTFEHLNFESARKKDEEEIDIDDVKE